ncbi:MAG: hypothetical protein H0T95_12880 [Chthoniobacterales bacterium]|nr:hypothetical protein [Chthoniobacterales bacterium]
MRLFFLFHVRVGFVLRRVGVWGSSFLFWVGLIVIAHDGMVHGQQT